MKEKRREKEKRRGEEREREREMFGSLHYNKIPMIFPTFIFMFTSSGYLEFNIPTGEFFLIKRCGYFALLVGTINSVFLESGS